MPFGFRVKNRNTNKEKPKRAFRSKEGEIPAEEKITKGRTKALGEDEEPKSESNSKAKKSFPASSPFPDRSSRSSMAKESYDKSEDTFFDNTSPSPRTRRDHHREEAHAHDYRGMNKTERHHGDEDPNQHGKYYEYRPRERRYDDDEGPTLLRSNTRPPNAVTHDETRSKHVEAFIAHGEPAKRFIHHHNKHGQAVHTAYMVDNTGIRIPHRHQQNTHHANAPTITFTPQPNVITPLQPSTVHSHVDGSFSVPISPYQYPYYLPLHPSFNPSFYPLYYPSLHPGSQPSVIHSPHPKPHQENEPHPPLECESSLKETQRCCSKKSECSSHHDEGASTSTDKFQDHEKHSKPVESELEPPEKQACSKQSENEEDHKKVIVSTPNKILAIDDMPIKPSSGSVSPAWWEQPPKHKVGLPPWRK